MPDLQYSIHMLDVLSHTIEVNLKNFRCSKPAEINFNSRQPGSQSCQLQVI